MTTKKTTRAEVERRNQGLLNLPELQQELAVRGISSGRNELSRLAAAKLIPAIRVSVMHGETERSVLGYDADAVETAIVDQGLDVGPKG